jgi:hypothetical protein
MLAGEAELPDAAWLQRTFGNQALVRAAGASSGSDQGGGGNGSQIVQRSPDGSHQGGCGCASCASLESIVERNNPAPAALAGAAPAASAVQRSLAQPTVQRHAGHAHDEEVQRMPALAAAHGPTAGCGCPSCSSAGAIVQRSLDASSAMVQRSAGGHEKGCSCPACSGAVQRSVTGVVQRSPQATATRSGTVAYGATWSPQTPIGPAPLVRPIMTRRGVLQRHASWEHRALGDVDPTTLGTLATWEEARDYYQLAKNAQQQGAQAPPKIQIEGQEVDPQNIMHIIQQEINRLKVWQDPEMTPKRGGRDAAAQLKHVANDPDWNLHLVEIPPKPQGAEPVVLTYGELNTLADFYGSADELMKTNSAAVLKVVQSVRRQSFEQLLSVYTKLKGLENEAAAKKELGVEKLGFSGAFNITGTVGEVGQIAVDHKGAINSEASYGSTLGRNACHFAPESWHTWEDWHHKALQKAKDAHEFYKKAREAQQQKQPQQNDQNVPQPEQEGVQSNLAMVVYQANGPSSSQLVQENQKKNGSEEDLLTAQAREAENLAMLYNGFGDHYLQDSYAAGHLINKTQVMQWFVQYLDKHPERTTFTTDTTWRQMQAMAYSQPGLAKPSQYNQGAIGRKQVGAKNKEVSTAMNPQSVENTSGDKDITWQDRFKMLGLKLPDSVLSKGPALSLMLYLQENSTMLGSWTYKELKEKVGQKVIAEGRLGKLLQTFDRKPQFTEIINETQLKQAIKSLLKDHIIFMGKLKKGFLKDTVDTDRRMTPKILSGEMGDDEIFVDTNTFELRKEYILGAGTGIGGPSQKFKDAKQGVADNNLDPIQKMVMATVYKDYTAWMRDSFIQKSTNALHDHFCVNGLKVRTGEGEVIGKIYGDMAMMNRDSAKGVKHSATTAQMSRDAIIQTVEDGNERPTHTTTNILNRLPLEVEVADNQYETIEVWHNDPELLRKTAETTVFANMTQATDNLAGGVSTVKSLGKLFKDQDVHGGEAF